MASEASRPATPSETAMGCAVLLALPVIALLLLSMCGGDPRDSPAYEACTLRGARWHMEFREWPTRPDGEPTRAYIARECERSTRAYPED